MSVLDALSSQNDRRDEGLNIKLAEQISKDKDEAKVKELIRLMKNGNKAIQSDCIKVLYEIGEVTPELIIDYLDVFLEYLENKNNRLQWGAMAAIYQITPLIPEKIYSFLPTILDASNKGSVITKDNAFKILVFLTTIEKLRKDVMGLLFEQLLLSFPNQLPMYAELALPIIDATDSSRFINVLNERLDDVEKESKKKRIVKVIQKAEKLKRE